ncbi:YceI family protein [Mycobacterium sp. AMU20-3851]|uniref:YceI family protein n=1 Tax=Mycobacterium sp. AMU20-3851 TaxID=3122055 RepID=UPI0037543203
MDLQDWLGTWRLDPGRTEVAFHSPTFWGLAHVNGVFTEVEGSAEAVAEGNVTGRLGIAAASVRTGIGRRDNHLRSDDFFDVRRYPLIEVAVEAAEATGPSWVTLSVQLTVKGIQHDLELPTHVRGLPGGDVRLETTTTLNRQTFGVNGNLFGMMGDAVTIEAAAVFVKQP